MAYIYSKNSGHCLILGTQESLTYPFNFPNFQEIRMGGFFSVVSGGSGNYNTQFQQISAQNITCAAQQLFIGFKDTGISLPTNPSANFVGVGRAYNQINNGIGSSYLCFSAPPSQPGNFLTSDGTGNTIFFNANTQSSIPITNGTPDTNYASFWGIAFGLIGNVFSGMVIYDGSNFYTDVSTGNLSKLVNSPPNTSSFITGYYTTGNVNSTNYLNIPNAIYIYFPYQNNQFRIHCLDIEQFS